MRCYTKGSSAEHTQWVKWVKVKFEIWHQGSKSFFHETKPAALCCLPWSLAVLLSRGSDKVAWWAPDGQSRSTCHTLHLHSPKDIPRSVGASMWKLGLKWLMDSWSLDIQITHVFFSSTSLYIQLVTIFFWSAAAALKSPHFTPEVAAF